MLGKGNKQKGRVKEDRSEGTPFQKTFLVGGIIAEKEEKMKDGEVNEGFPVWKTLGAKRSNHPGFC